MKDPMLALMKEYNAPMTREDYLNASFLGKTPTKLHPEEEEMLPKPFRHLDREVNEKLWNQPPQADGRLQERGAKKK